MRHLEVQWQRQRMGRRQPLALRAIPKMIRKEHKVRHRRRKAKWYSAARQAEGATPQPVQGMDLDGLLHVVAGQQRLAREVFTCSEADAFRQG
jgi:hypothetical protein